MPDQLLSALVPKIREDSSVVVRLAAVECLSFFASRMSVASELVTIACDDLQNIFVRQQAAELLQKSHAQLDLKGVRHILKTFKTSRNRQPWHDVLIRLVADTIVSSEKATGI